MVFLTRNKPGNARFVKLSGESFPLREGSFERVFKRTRNRVQLSACGLNEVVGNEVKFLSVCSATAEDCHHR